MPAFKVPAGVHLPEELAQIPPLFHYEFEKPLRGETYSEMIRKRGVIAVSGQDSQPAVERKAQAKKIWDEDVAKVLEWLRLNGTSCDVPFRQSLSLTHGTFSTPTSTQCVE